MFRLSNQESDRTNNSKLLGESWYKSMWHIINTLRPTQNGRHAADIFKCKSLNEIFWILNKILLNYIA